MSLQFSDTSVEKAGLIQTLETNVFGDRGYTQISGDASRLAIFTNLLNEAFSRYTSLAMKFIGWNFDDSNFTTVPIATANLVLNQQDYGLATSHIKILGVEIKESGGNWRPLTEIDELEFSRRNESLSAYYNNGGTAITGTPLEYNLIGTSVFLYPTPSYNSTGGIKIRFQRPPSYFATTDTTKVAGINELHHTYLTDYATWKYSINKDIKKANAYAELVGIWEQKTIPNDYARRDAAKNPKMTFAPAKGVRSNTAI